MREREYSYCCYTHMWLPTKCSIVFIVWRVEEKDVTINPQVHLEVVQYIKNQA